MGALFIARERTMATVSRRRFLELVGAAGGSGAVYRVASALGLMATPGAAPLAQLAPLQGAKRKVLILGAGIGGLTAAYELRKVGYDCTILESSSRAGGRNLTLRHGDRVDELGQTQICRFDDNEDLYFNAGAARIPPDHTLLMSYCRTLGVELQLWNNDNRNAYYQDDNAFGGKPVRQRQYIADTRGFMSELLAKSVSATAQRNRYRAAPCPRQGLRRSRRQPPLRGLLPRRLQAWQLRPPWRAPHPLRFFRTHGRQLLAVGYALQ